MISLLLAAALTAATPTTPPVTPPTTTEAERRKNLANDAPLVCAAHFVEELKIAREKLEGHEPVIIDLYAKKAGLTDSEKTLLTSYCNMFDMGVGFAIEMSQPEDDGIVHRGLDSPSKHIASFTR